MGRTNEVARRKTGGKIENIKVKIAAVANKKKGKSLKVANAQMLTDVDSQKHVVLVSFALGGEP